MHKRYFKRVGFAAGVLFSATVSAWDYCFDIACPECNAYTPQQLRVDYHAASGHLTGIIQGNQDEFGEATAGWDVAQTGKAYFSRYGGSGRLYSYEIDLQTLTGSRQRTSYSFNNMIEYNAGGFRDQVLTAVPCPP